MTGVRKEDLGLGNWEAKEIILNHLFGKTLNHQLKEKKKKNKERSASLYQCIIHYQAKQIFKYCMETCSDGEPEIYLARKGDREFMLIGLMLLILDLHTNIRIDVTCICYALVTILLHVFIRGLTVLSLILFPKYFLISCNNNNKGNIIWEILYKHLICLWNHQGISMGHIMCAFIYPVSDVSKLKVCGMFKFTQLVREGAKVEPKSSLFYYVLLFYF